MISIENSTTREIWKGIERKLEANKEPYATLNAIYEFQLTDEENSIYQLALKDGTATVHFNRQSEPDCTLKMKEKYFKKFLLGNLNSTTAFMTGKLKVDGNIGLALKLENMLKQFDFTN
ncbi:SCP2 sterol-binding domain-containing protein [Virgibacillus sp. C22-A2]|uniref:SCP2 sterol-binding domain-containing protein n=1 Tax=Virgibacillus tibetensis TaxID=3042313 RepID=A0ABU6KL33_9BACI|nr:SCP2 sterol-binding domain-containing protein [Virgibacillus sp. C22-A2]